MAHVNVFGQEFVGNAVFVNDVVVQSSTAEDCSREESEDTICVTMSVSCVARDSGKPQEAEKVETEVGRCLSGGEERDEASYPPRKAPTGLRTGMAPTGTSSKRAELWKLRRVMAGVERPAMARRRAGIERAREAIVCVCAICVSCVGGDKVYLGSLRQ